MRKRTRLGWAWLMLSLFVVAGSAHAAPGVGNNRGAWLGIYSQTLTTELRDGLDYRGSGVLVNRVVSDSPADQAGLEKGDIILSVNSNSVESPEDLSDAIQSHQPGDAVKLEIVRDGDRRSITANLSARNSDDGAGWTAGSGKSSRR